MIIRDMKKKTGGAASCLLFIVRPKAHVSDLVFNSAFQ